MRRQSNRPTAKRKIVKPEIGPKLPKFIEDKVRRCKTSRNRCLTLWAEGVKARAGYRSELTGAKGVLNAHHIVGRRGRAAVLLTNGICLTRGEHMYGVHHHNETTAAEWDAKIIKFIGGYGQKELLLEATKDLDIDWVVMEENLRKVILMYLGGPNG